MQRSAGQHCHLARLPRPNFVEACVEGGLPRGIGIERLRDLPTEWNRQRLSDLLPNSVSAKPRIRAAYPALRLRAQRRPPGSEFCGPETERREWLLNGWTPAGTKIREIDSRKSAPKRPLAKFKEIGGKNKIAFPTKHLRLPIRFAGATGDAMRQNVQP